jgi:hypothetical protein
MFFIDQNGNEVHSECSHDYSAEAEARISKGEDWGDVSEELTQRFADSIKGSYDSEDDVGAVVEYFKDSQLVAYFDYENFQGTQL